jgi:NADPH-dependent stearoyl-CoA 9-desaturase
MPTLIESPIAHLTEEQIEEIGREFDAIHDEVRASLGDRDRKYITSMIEMHRRLLVMSRVMLFFGKYKPAWVIGTAGLSLAKILENMEIGHNVLHGQWDWMNDPYIHSSTWDWDTASTAEAWKHSHNYVHHTYTNILGKDKDLGYEIMRIDPHQKWHPVYLAQPFYNLLLAAFFEWGVALHDLDIEAVQRGEKDPKKLKKELKGIWGKARNQIVKDYIAFPALSLVFGKQGFKAAFTANFTANIVRNVWAYAIIFCGHFPDQTYVFTQEETEDESRGAFYLRQLHGAANIDGSPLFHVISGNLGYQVEHHLFPDMPSTRYAEIAPQVKAICERYELPYNTGPFLKQLGNVQRTIIRLAFPGGKPRPKPGPYKGHDVDGASGRFRRPEGQPTGENGSGPEQPDDGVRVEMPQEA